MIKPKNLLYKLGIYSYFVGHHYLLYGYLLFSKIPHIFFLSLRGCILQSPHTSAKEKLPSKAVSAIQSNAFGYPETAGYSIG